MLIKSLLILLSQWKFHKINVDAARMEIVMNKLCSVHVHQTFMEKNANLKSPIFKLLLIVYKILFKI